MVLFGNRTWWFLTVSARSGELPEELMSNGLSVFRLCLIQFCFLTLFFTFFCQSVTASQSILIIHSDQAGTAEAVTHSRQIRRIAGSGYDIKNVFLDARRLDTDSAFEFAERNIASLVREEKPDLVLTLGDEALVFADRYRVELFKGKPLLFALVKDRYLAQKNDSEGKYQRTFSTSWS